LACLRCSDCGQVVVVCDEIGNVFDNLDDPLLSLPLVIWRSVGHKCPKCNSVLLADFAPAGLNDLARLGIRASDCEPGPALTVESLRRLGMS